jgi:GcrA cell cycle regulator
MGVPALAQFEWAQDRVALLKKLWARGLSASQIGGQLGCSRNAVISKIHRINLPGRDSKQSIAKAKPQREPQPPREPKPDRRRAVASPRKRIIVDGRPAFAPDLTLIEPALEDVAIPLEQRVSLMQLTNETCRFPVGEPGTDTFFFCGKRQADMAHGHPYCRHHARIAGRGYSS